ncbi:MAG: hypothetical protein JWR32_3288 [Mycobacterium sp.]|jgi:hypothetical protein|nr:hypothetical protein [Mycobacterium sp.]
MTDALTDAGVGVLESDYVDAHAVGGALGALEEPPNTQVVVDDPLVDLARRRPVAQCRCAILELNQSVFGAVYRAPNCHL